MANLLCSVGWHRWEKWGQMVKRTRTHVGTVLYGVSVAATEPYEYDVLTQDRTCKTCGCAQRREVRENA